MEKTKSKGRTVLRDAISELCEAVIAGKLAVVKRLLLGGAKIDESDRDGFTPLMLAAAKGDDRLTKYFLGQGANVNLRNNIGQTALMMAAAGGHRDVAEELVLAGADVRATDVEKRNAISWTASRGDFPEVISTLAVLGVDYNAPDASGLTPLMRAALLGYANTVAVLLTVGADEKARFRGKTAYQLARAQGQDAVCKTMKAVLKNRPKGHAL